MGENLAMRIRPIQAVSVVLAVVAAGVAANYMLQGGLRGVRFIRVAPDAAHEVRIDVSDLARNELRFYRFLNAGNQEVKFFVGRDRNGDLHVAFDASETHARVGRGFRQEGEWVIDNKCDTPTRLTEVREGRGGCSPVPLAFRAESGLLVLTEEQILRGWRLFH